MTVVFALRWSGAGDRGSFLVPPDGLPNVYTVDGGTNAWLAAGGARRSQAPGESGGYDEGLQEELPFGYEPARARVEGLSAAACSTSAVGQPPVVPTRHQPRV